MSYKAVVQGQMGRAASILSTSDAILTTYYPEVSDFKSNRNQVDEDLTKIANVFPDEVVYLAEVGFPSSQSLGSSEELQKDFVDSFFSAWDNNKEAIPSATFVWLYDLSQETLEAIAESYGSDDPEFLSFLGSLGYLRNNREEKKSYKLLLENIEERR